MPTPFPLRTRLASSILLACSSLLTAAPAAWAAETAAEQNEQLSFDIPAQSLDDALSAYGIASGAQVLYDAGLTQGLKSQPVTGHMDRQQALQQLLNGTGLDYRFTGARTITLQTGVPAYRRAARPWSLRQS